VANWEFVLEGRQGGSDMLTVLHYISSGVEPPDFSAAASVVKAHLGDHIAALCAPRVTWLGITVREDIPGGVGTFIPFPTGTLAGAQSAPDHMDVAVALVRKVTGSLVRPTQGWIMQGGIAVTRLDANGAWESATMTGIDDFWTDMLVLNIAGPTTLTMVVKARNPTAPNTQAYTVVNTITVAPAPRALRTRMAGQGS